LCEEDNPTAIPCFYSMRGWFRMKQSNWF